MTTTVHLILVMMLCLATSVVSASAATTVSNTISVEARSTTGGGASTVRAYSVVNGEVVEDYSLESTEESVSHQSTIAVNDLGSSTLATSTTPADLSTLYLLLAELLSLLRRLTLLNQS